MSENRVLRAGITAGDLGGVGTEVIIKALADSRIYDNITPVVYGSAKAFAFYKRGIEGVENFSVSLVQSAAEAAPKRVNLVECGPEDIRIDVGKATAESGAVAVTALQKAMEDIDAGDLDLLITAPINKENVHGENFPYTGHTEFLAAEREGEPVMIMCSENLRVALATIHLPVSEVSAHLTKEGIVGTLKVLNRSLIEDFGAVAPRIAVLALNPHAGDGGLLGKEEQEIIKPAIEEAFGEKILAFGPFAADGFFASGAWKKYDAVVAMYHDQGLTPFKTLSPDGVNYTAGLDIVRTSPDHGTGYDIAGQDKADAQSMRNAIYMAVDVYRNRQRYAEMSRNPLRHYERDKGRDVSVSDLPEIEEAL